MTGSKDQNASRLSDQAADWVVRLSGDSAGEADWLAFQDWIDADGQGEARRAAFDQAQSVWLELDAAAGGPAFASRRPAVRNHQQRRSAATWWGAGLAAAASVAALAFVAFKPALAPPQTMAFATGIGEHRTVRLPDGTRIDLNAGSRLTVTYAAGERRVQMQEAEAAFDVVHDPSRPFVITVGDSQIRVLGTAFDVRHYDGDTRLSVSRGVVQLSADGQVLRLAQGAAASHHDGASLQVVHQDPGGALAWREGRLLYVDQPLTRVVEDLNRQYERPIRLGDAAAAGTRFTGVIVLGAQAETLHRLTGLAALNAQVVGNEVVLSARRP